MIVPLSIFKMHGITKPSKMPPPFAIGVEALPIFAKYPVTFNIPRQLAINK
jgi:hypothetical protein